MDQVRNPFVPGAGTPPPELAGRDDILERAQITLARIAQGRAAKSFMLIGLRGVGKTVLLNKIKEQSVGLAYKHIMLEAHESKSLPELLVPHLRHLLYELDKLKGIGDKAKRGLRILRAFAGAIKIKMGEVEVGLEPELGTADSGDLEADLPMLFQSVAEAGAADGTPIAVIIDELQYLDEHELSALIMAIHKINQNSLPLVLIGAGLPQLVGLSGESKSYAERLFDFPNVGALSEDDAINALQGPAQKAGATFADKALSAIFTVTQGYPYFLQEWGYHAWNKAESSPIDLVAVKAAHGAAIRNLDESFFRVRFDRMTPREKEYLRAMAELGSGSHRSSEIAEILGVKTASVAPLRSGLIKKGMIYSPAHGDTTFTVPLFDDYMKRIMPKVKRGKQLPL